jgi:ethanolamine ammonia-lyase large subunit
MQFYLFISTQVSVIAHVKRQMEAIEKLKLTKQIKRVVVLKLKKNLLSVIKSS